MNLCLIGSTRFMDKYLEWNRKLSVAGHVVYSVATRSSAAAYDKKKPDPQELTEDEKETLDLVHLLKLLRSDAAVLITDSSLYVGTSTKREIKWCLMQGKQILLPEHMISLQTNINKTGEWLRQEWDTKVSVLDTSTKINPGNLKI